MEHRASPGPSASSTLRAFLAEMRGVRRESWGNPLGYLFIAPALILYLVFNFWVLIRGFLMAFTNYRFLVPNSNWSWNGLRNYELMLRDRFFAASLIISAKYIVMVLPSIIILALVVALMIHQVPRGAGFFRWLVYLPVILPISVSMLMWQQLYNSKYGYIDSLLRDLGVANPPDWLGDAHYALASIALASVWRSFGFPTLLFLVGLYNISKDLYEAASIDGASGIQQLWHITLPLLRPTFALVLVLQIGLLYGTQEVLLLTNGGPADATKTVGFYIYSVAFSEGDLRLGYAAAMSLVVGLFMSIFTALTLRILRGEPA
ncbi:MAG: sugar ABC transporter permease [Chloroflexi bacterium]|nr:sugar ABC transporter permease [Chloroflexota bacterium]